MENLHISFKLRRRPDATLKIELQRTWKHADGDAKALGML